MGSSVGLHCPDFHFPETLSPELSLSPEGLLGHKGIRPDGTGMNFVVHQMMQFEHVHGSHCDCLIERLAGTPVIERGLGCFPETALSEQCPDLIFLCPVKNRGGHVDPVLIMFSKVEQLVLSETVNHPDFGRLSPRGGRLSPRGRLGPQVACPGDCENTPQFFPENPEG